MQEEMEGLCEVGTFEHIKESSVSNIVGAKWIFKWKTNEFGELMKAKQDLLQKDSVNVRELIIQKLFLLPRHLRQYAYLLQLLVN